MRSLAALLAATLLPVTAFAACPAGEASGFSCKTDTAREASVCQGEGTTTYRYGRVGAPEITVPVRNTDVVWQHGESPRAGIIDILYFTDGTTRYSVMHTANATDPADADAHITVSRAGKENAFIECASGISFNPATIKAQPSEITEQPPPL